MKRSIPVALVGGLLAGLLVSALAGAADVTRGRALYVQVGCYACHGLEGQGAQPTGPRLSRTVYPLEAFLVMLRHPAAQMPPYGAAVLSDADAADIHAWLRSLPAPRDPATIPLLRGTR